MMNSADLNTQYLNLEKTTTQIEIAPQIINKQIGHIAKRNPQKSEMYLEPLNEVLQLFQGFQMVMSVSGHHGLKVSLGDGLVAT